MDFSPKKSGLLNNSSCTLFEPHACLQHHSCGMVKTNANIVQSSLKGIVVVCRFQRAEHLFFNHIVLALTLLCLLISKEIRNPAQYLRLHCLLAIIIYILYGYSLPQKPFSYQLDQLNGIKKQYQTRVPEHSTGRENFD